jgi:hypothetical protein
MSRLLRLLVSIAALPLLLSAAPPPTEASAAPLPPNGAVRVTVETIAVDRRGTWSLGTDVADLFSGDTGVLEKSATLISRGGESGAREMVKMTTRLTPILNPGGGCTLRLETETKGVVAGRSAKARPRQPDRTRATIVLEPEQERLVDTYASAATQGRLALKVRCETPPAASRAMSESDLRFVDFVLSVERAEGDEEPLEMKPNRLRAIVGREASSLFSFNVPLDPDATGAKRYRREKLEVTLTPTLMSGGRAQILFGVRGELATVSADTAPISHPIDHEETVVVAPGEARLIEIDVHSSGPEEGWGRVRYRLSIVGTF